MKTYRTVKVIIFDKDEHILLLRRSKTHPTQGLQMDFPGGIIEDGEEPVEALLREVSEETGLHVAAEDLKLAYAEAGESDGFSAVRLVYIVKLRKAKPDIRLSWEHEESVWTTIGTALQELNPKKYKKRALAYLVDNDVLKDL